MASLCQGRKKGAASGAQGWRSVWLRVLGDAGAGPGPPLPREGCVLARRRASAAREYLLGGPFGDCLSEAPQPYRVTS